MSDHISVLGNEAVLADVIRVATGHAHELQDRIVSDIDAMAAQVDFDPPGMTQPKH